MQNTVSLGAPKLMLNQFLPYQLVSLADQVSRIISQTYSPMFNLSRPEWRVLASLEELGQVSATSICGHSAQDKMTVSRAIASLESKGFLVRRSATDDRRNKHLELTEAGHRLYQNIVPLILAKEAGLLSTLSNEENILLNTLLSKLKKQADTMLQISETSTSHQIQP